MSRGRGDNVVMGLVVLVSLLVVGCASSSNSTNAGTPDPSGDPTAASVTPAPATTTAGGADLDDIKLVSQPNDWEYLRADVTSGVGYPWPIQEQYGPVPLMLDPGSYDTDVLGSDVTVSLAGPLRLELEIPNQVLLVDPTSKDLFPETSIGLYRAINFPDPTLLGIGPPIPPPAADGYRMEPWLAAVPQLRAEQVVDLSISGYPARHYQLVVDPDLGRTWECGVATECIDFFNGDGLEEPIMLSTDQRIEAWVVDLGAEVEELVVLAVSPSASSKNDAWFATAAELANNLKIGEARSSVMTDNHWERGVDTIIPAGAVRLPIGPGVEFELPTAARTRMRSGWAYMTVSEEGVGIQPNVEVVAAPFRVDRSPIADAAELVVLLEDAGGVVTGTMEVDGREATIVELLGVRPGQPVFLQTTPREELPTEPLTWWTQDYVRFVVFDTSVGAMGITAEAEDENGLALSVAVQEVVLATLDILD